MAMGYCTLYGDMCGGFALIKDVPKPQYSIYAVGEMSNPKSSLPKLLTAPPLPSCDRIKKIPTRFPLPSARPHS